MASTEKTPHTTSCNIVIEELVVKNTQSRPMYDRIVPGNTGIMTPRSPMKPIMRAIIDNVKSIFMLNSICSSKNR
jgi:hypothetical protein